MHRLLILPLLACGAVAAAPGSAKPKPPPKPVTTANPCFAGKPPIVAAEMWKQLEKYSWSVYLSEGEPPPPPTTYGSCKVERNKVTTAAGTPVAELGCGVRILVPGVRDSLGNEVGTPGKTVLARMKRTEAMTCMANGPDQVRCRADRPEDSDTDPDWYVVAGTLGEDVATGDTARQLLSAGPLVELGVSIWCH